MDLLEVWQVFGHATGITKRPSENELPEFDNWKRNENIARILIRNNIENDQMIHITRCETVAEMWESLKHVYETHSIQTAVELKRKLTTMRATNNDDVRKHLTDMKTTRTRLEMMGRSVNDEDFKLSVVSSLPESWDYWTMAYLASEESNGDKPRINSQQLISIICDEAERRNTCLNPKRKRNETNVDEDKDKKDTAYQVMGRTGNKKPRRERPEKFRPCKICGKTNHKTPDCRHKGRPKCGGCGKFGHTTPECWYERGKDRDRPRKSERANMARKNNSAGPSTTHDVDLDCENSDFSCYDWLADTATTCHISNRKEILNAYKERREEINGIGEIAAECLGRGTATLVTKINNEKHTIKLNDVCYVPSATNSLLSIGLFDESKGTTVIRDGTMSLYANNTWK